MMCHGANKKLESLIQKIWTKQQILNNKNNDFFFYFWYFTIEIVIQKIINFFCYLYKLLGWKLKEVFPQHKNEQTIKLII